MAMASFALAANAQNAQQVVVTDASINAGDVVTWTSNNEYLLDGMVFVESGAELYIEAGTVIKAEDGSGNESSGLVISQGGKIFAEGTASNPIIFTSKYDDLQGSLTYQDRGLWGGVILLGYAPTNNAGIRQIEGVNEIVGAGDNRADYGGNDPDDSSGVMRYVSIRHTGKAVGDQAGNEIQGLTMGAVGRGTTLEYIESYASDDDGFEWFGGTVDAKYLVSSFNNDDSFDWDEGYNGRGQFWFVIQGTDKAGRMAEMDGAIGDEQGSPYTLPQVANVTYLGDGLNNPGQVDGDGSQGLIFRDNSGGSYFNSIFGDYKGQPGAPALTIEDVSSAASEDSRKRLEAGDLKLLNNYWFDFAAGTSAEALFPQDFVRSSANFAGNQITDPQLRGISREANGGLDPRPANASSAKFAADASLYTDSWFDNVSYLGAFGDTNWLRGWTALDDNGFAGNLDGGPEPSVSASYISGWNMVSVPTVESSFSATDLFPTSLEGTLYSFSGSYQLVETMTNGQGYWLNLESADDISFNGSLLTSQSLDLALGWNMIGSISSDASLQDPNNVTLDGTLYAFNGTYNLTSTLEPGYGYWIATTESGTVSLTPGAAMAASASPSPREMAEQSSLNRVTFESEERSQTLFFGGELEGDFHPLQRALPPVPPAGSFDVRFADGSWITPEGEVTIRVQGDAPVSVTLNGSANGSAYSSANNAVTFYAGSTELDRVQLLEGESVALPQGTDRITIGASAEFATEIPDVASLDQNYPNPFNPTTSIRFGIPAKSEVTLDVFNMLGQRVAQLVNSEMNAGYHTIGFDASSLSSGMYIYRLQAGNFTATKKLMLVK